MENKQTYQINSGEPDLRSLGIPQPSAMRGEAGRPAGMTVPEGFFDAFRQRMEAEIDKAETTAAKTRRMQRLRRWSIAASVAIVVGVAALIGNMSRQQVVMPSAAESVTVAQQAPAEVAETESDMMLASLSDYDIYETMYDID